MSAEESFVAEFKKLATINNPEVVDVVAAEVLESLKSRVRMMISETNNNIVATEENLLQAKKNFKNVIHNHGRIELPQNFVNKVIDAHNEIVKLENQLKTYKEQLELFESLYK